REVRQDLQTHLLALLRVKLRGHEIAAADAANEIAAVIRRAGDHGFVRWHDVIAVDEVDAAPFVQAAEQRGRSAEVELVPSHVRDLEPLGLIDVKTYALAGQ